ncbi:MAG: FAD-binding oxidoreductase [Myxococcota bacterium]
MTTVDSGSAALDAGADIAAAIADIVGPAHVDDSTEQLAAPAIPAGAPAWLVRPSSAAEVAELVGLANRHDIAVVPVGSQARAPRAALDQRKSLFVDTRRMNHVLHLDETSLIVHVQAGLTALGLERILAPRNLSLGDYPPAALGSTIGGLISVRTPGKSSPRHGFVEDAVLGVSAVLANGRSIHTRVAPRRSTGPDLARALCGSEGTLGFITSVVLRIHRAPQARLLCAHALPDFDAALAAVHLALREEAAPAALRVYDAREARAHFGAERWPNDEALLVAATAGPSDLAACDRDLLSSAAEAMGARVLDNELAELWWRRRTGREVEGDDPPPPLPALQVTAAPSTHKAVYRAVLDAIDKAGFLARVHASRFERDGAVFFFSFADPSSSSDDAPLRDDELVRARTIAAEAAAGAGAVLLGTSHAKIARYLDELRRALDPKGIMNPGALRS